MLTSKPRTATVRAATPCDLFVLDKADFQRILRDNPQFADGVVKVARERSTLCHGRVDGIKRRSYLSIN